VAFQPCPITAKFELRFLRAASQVENVVHISKTGGWDIGTLQTAAEACVTQIAGNWLTAMPADTQFLEVKATDISVEGGAQFIASAPGGSIGVNGGAPLPNETSIAIRLRAATGGRSGAGRLFWIALTQTMMADTNNVTTVLADALVTHVTELFNDVTTAVPTSYPVVVSRKQHNVVLPTAIAYAIVNISLFDRLVDSQARRKPGRGA